MKLILIFQPFIFSSVSQKVAEMLSVFFSYKMYVLTNTVCFKDGAYYCYCAYVLRISRYLGFLWVVPTNTGIFLRALKLCVESRTQQVIFISKKKSWGNHTFFRDNNASIWKKATYIALYFTVFLNYCCLIFSEKCLVTPNFLFGFQ